MILASQSIGNEILTLVLPVAFLAAVGIYWWVLLRRRSPGAQSGNVE